MDKQFSPEQSIQLIEKMIESAKARLANQSFYFIMWGYLLFLAGLSEYFLEHIFDYPNYWIGWPIAGFGGGIVSMIYGMRQSAKAKNTSHHLDKAISMVWLGFFVSVWLIIIGLPKDMMSYSSSIIMVMTGWATLATSAILKFKPLQFSTAVFWIIGFISFKFFLPYTALLFSLAIFLGYIIPGHLLRHAEKNNTI